MSGLRPEGVVGGRLELGTVEFRLEKSLEVQSPRKWKPGLEIGAGGETGTLCVAAGSVKKHSHGGEPCGGSSRG